MRKAWLHSWRNVSPPSKATEGEVGRTQRREVSAGALGITPRELRAIESGSSHPDREMISRMADHYRIDAGRLGADVMIPRSDPGIDPDRCIIWLSWLPVGYGSTSTTSI